MKVILKQYSQSAVKTIFLLSIYRSMNWTWSATIDHIKVWFLELLSYSCNQLKHLRNATITGWLPCFLILWGQIWLPLSHRCVVALDEITDPQNLGAILRTCHFLGVSQVTSKLTQHFKCLSFLNYLWNPSFAAIMLPEEVKCSGYLVICIICCCWFEMSGGSMCQELFPSVADSQQSICW